MGHANTLTNNLLVHLTFDDSTFADDSGNGINGTAVGTPAIVPGLIGAGAVSVTTLKDRSEIDYVSLGYPALLQFSNSQNFSVSFWTSYTNQVDDPPFISNKNWNSSGNTGWGIFCQDNGNFRVNLTDNNGVNESTSTTPIIRDGAWHHIVVTFDRSSSAAIFVDGAQVNSLPIASATGTIDTADLGYSVDIGQDGTGGYTDNGSAQMVDVKIDDLAIWGRVLTPLEVGAIYQGGLLGSNVLQVVAKLTPSLTSLQPAPGSVYVPANPVLSATMLDADTAVATNTVQLSLDGTRVAATVTKAATLTTVVYPTTNILAAGSTHTVGLSFSDNNTPTADQFTTNFQFTVVNYPILPAGLAQAQATINTGAPGFQMRVSQIDATAVAANDGTPYGTLAGCVARAEAQLAGLLTDPMTGLNYDETITPGSLPNGAYPIGDVLNFSLGGAAQGNFTSANGFPDAAIPGQTLGDGNNLAVEFVTYLQLSPGFYQFGVSSSEGFRMTIGTNALDVLSQQLGIFDARRTTDDTIFYLEVTQAGYYPCRIVWFRQSSLPDNNPNNVNSVASFELYTVTELGQKILVNDLTNPQAVRAYQSSTASFAPYIKYAGPTAFVSPYRASGFGLPAVQIQLADGSSAAVATNSVHLSIDGSAVATSIAQSNGLTTVTYSPNGLQLPRTVYSAQLSYTANGTPHVNAWQFDSLKNYVLPAPLYYETFDAAPHGGLPANWVQVNYTDVLNTNEDFNDPNSQTYLGWTVVQTTDGASFGDWSLNFNVATYQELNGSFFDGTTNPLMVNQFLFAESDNRSGKQIQYVYTPFYNLSGHTGVVVAFNSAYEQNQNNINSLEYTVDQGSNWFPVMYYLMGETDSQDSLQILHDPNGNVDAVGTLTTVRNLPHYTDSTGKNLGGTYGSFILAPITQALGPYFEGRVNDDAYEGHRIEVFQVPGADNQPSVQFRFEQMGTGSWYWGIDNWGIYSVATLPSSTPGPLSITVSGVNAALTWTASPIVHLQQTATLSNPIWRDVAGTLGVGSFTSALGTTNMFYHLVQQ